MSFVGPRPERPHFVRQLEQSVPYYGLRLKTVDGTLETFYGDGTVAGVSGRRGTTSGAILSAGEWVHYAAVVESRNEMRLFVNGSEVVRDGEITAARPGTVLRSGRDTDTVEVPEP